MSKSEQNRLTDWAHFRFSVIGGLLARPPDPGKLQKELQEVARRRYRHPISGDWVSFGASTIERWYYRALNTDDPIGALGRKVRSDLGRSVATSAQLLKELARQYARYPHWSYQLHADNLAALVQLQPDLGQAPSYATVIRRMQQHGWIPKPSAARNQSPGQRLAAERLEKCEVRSFEADHVHGLWHLDFHQCKRRIVDAAGRWHKPVVLCILDDCSRLCCHIQWYLNETAENLFHGLMQAFHKRGLPRSLMSDNGAAMTAHETANGLVRLAIVHEATLPHSPYQNGKQEAFWGQLEGRLIKMLSQVRPLTLEFLNRATQAWAEMEYNRCRHEEIGTSPLKRMLQGPEVSRPSVDTDALRFYFTAKQRRTQRKSDGTIQIQGVRFEVPSRFRHFHYLYVGYQSWDLTRAYLLDQRTGTLLCQICPLDKHKNADGHRRSLQLPACSGVSQIGKDHDPIPPLLRKILADYAASGLPPAYLPKEELLPPDQENTHE